MKQLYLPCLRGIIGNWTYYSTVMKIKDIVDNNRIITVAESDDLYTKNINEILQREINKSRINKISKYLQTSEERFFNSLTVAIHQGNPQWYDIDIGSRFEIENATIDTDTINFIENKFGILALSGGEQIFALDGQHRLIGIRDAYKINPELGEEEISLIYVVHNQENKEKTRRLFTVLNKYAEKPKGAELIIIDEDDCRAINTRKLVEEHPIFIKKNALSSSKSGNIQNNDFDSFTTLVTINNINNILYKKQANFYTQRPSDELLEEFYAISKEFWDFFFNIFPEIEQFIDGQNNIELNGKFNRNSDTGGSLLLRPVGQELVARIYMEFKKNNDLDNLKTKLRKVDFNLSGNIFRYLFWHKGKMQSKDKDLKYKLLKYILGIFDNKKFIDTKMTEIYKNSGAVYDSNLISVL